jgi:DNA (cytosine-5)-methyltransferase 1
MKQNSSKLVNKIKKIRCVDLFAGAGGFSLAARNVGMTVVAAIEKNQNACITYRENLIDTEHKTTLYDSDILDLTPQDVLAKHFSDAEPCDVVLGGPPCQGFSTHRINDAGIDDPRNKLVLRYFEYVAALRPKVFLMENVPGILWERHKKFLQAFYAEGKKTGYQIKEPITLDARDFGVPQRRRRVFILGVREDFLFEGTWPPAQTHARASGSLTDSQLTPWLPASQVFSVPTPESDVNGIHMNHSEKLVEVFKSTPINGGSRHQSIRILPCHADHTGHKDVYGRIDPALPGPTMTTACINPSKGRFVHPTENHGITVRHAARFQTFPDSFIFHGGLMSAGQQIGNAVPILLGQVLLTEIKSGILNGEKIMIKTTRQRKEK